jgi:hypothetical protein
MANISKLQFQQQKWSSEFVDQNNLSQALLTRPEIADTLYYIWGDKFILGYLTQGAGKYAQNYELIGNEEYKWALMGNLTKTSTITIAASPSTKTGIGFSEFTLGLNDRYMSLGDTLKVGRDTILRVQSEPVQLGSNFVYRLVIVGNDASAFVAATDIAVGKEVAWVGSAFEEMSDGGSSKRAMPMWFKNQLTTTRYSTGMSGSAASDVMVLKFKDKNGNKAALWEYQERYQAMMMHNRQRELNLWYSRYNRTPSGEIMLPGANGRPVKTGAGWREQVAYSNTRTYSDLTEEYFMDFASDLQVLSKGVENSKFTVVTGSAGMKRWKVAMRESLKAAQIVDTQFYTKKGTQMQFNPNNITTYKGILGTELTVIYNPMQDDRSLHTDIDAETGLPKESSTFYFMENGEYDGESNVTMMAKGANGINRSLVSWCTAGSTLPDGDSGTKQMMRSNSLDGFACHMLSEIGIKIKNPLSCGILEKA